MQNFRALGAPPPDPKTAPPPLRISAYAPACENVNRKSLGRSLLAVAAAAENLLKQQS